MWKKRKQKETEQDVAPEAPAKKVSPLKGRKLGPRKPKHEKITRAQLATELKPGLNALFGLEFKKTVQAPSVNTLLQERALQYGTFVSLAKTAQEFKKTVQAPSVNTLLQERALQYGTFVSLAKTAQEFKSVLYRELGSRNKRLADDQSEALDMILHKIARIINGNADHIDSWADIAGYATLVAERLQGRTL